MKEKYQKYYAKLKDKDYSSFVSKYKMSLTTVKTKMDSVANTISSSRWTEKGIKLIKSSVIPSLKSQVTGIDTGLNSLENACSKVKTLVVKLSNLESLCKSLEHAENVYNNASEEGKSSALSNVNYYKERVEKTEQEIDALIADINGISVDIKDVSTTFAETMETLKEYNSLEALKQEFLGSLDDDSWYIDPAYAHKAKELLLFDNTTGEILKEGDTLNMKVGETRVLTVRVPHNAGRVKQVIRTSAGGDDTFLSGHVVKAKSDINPDPNVVERVNYKYSVYWPQDMSILRTTSYDWIITATEKGGVQISQTCEYKVEENSGTPKAMVDIHVNVS